MANVNSILDYPDITFIDGITQSELESQMIQWYKEKRKELTGKDITLGRADDRRLILSTAAAFLYQGYMYADNAGKNGLLKYATGEYLENLGALKGITRLDASGATVTIRFTMSSARASVTPIPAGSRVTSGDSIYFETNEYAEIPIGNTYIDVQATCSTAGTEGNGYAIGEINVMVDPVPFVDSVSNTTIPANGRDTETDDELRARIYAAPESYTTGGTGGAYEYLVREHDTSILDVKVTSPSPRVVQIVALLNGGEIPSTQYINDLSNYISDPSRKMLTDEIVVQAPAVRSYNISLTYYINESDKSKASTIQAGVNNAVEAYKLWQKGKIGRDLNPNELMKRILAAGAKRAVITAPSYTVISDDAVAIAGTVNVVYGGLEAD